jgi:hypothetical protein
VLLCSPGYQQVGSSVAPGWTVWPTGASVEAGDDRMEKLLLTVREAADGGGARASWDDGCR